MTSSPSPSSMTSSVRSLDLEGDLIEHVHDGGKKLALVGLRIHVHAFHQAP